MGKQTRHNMATALVYGLFALFACIVSLISQAVIRALLNVYSNTAANKHYSTVPAVGKPHWLLGHVFLVFKTNGHQIFDFITARMQTMQTKVLRGNSVLFSGSRGELYISDPVAVEHILKTNYNNYIKLDKGQSSIWGVKFFFGQGVFRADHGPHAHDGGKSWYHQRKLTSKMFNTFDFKNFIYETFCEKGDLLVDHLRANNPQVPVDMQDYFFRYTMDSFGKIALKSDFDSIRGRNTQFGEAFDAAHAAFLELRAARPLLMSLVLLFPDPSTIRSMLDWLVMKVVPEAHRFKTHIDELHRHCVEVIKERTANPAELNDSKDLLALFLRSQTSGDWSNKHMSDVILNLIIAGRDTTACTLSWALYELVQNSDVMARLREELAGCDGYETIKSNTYLTAVLYETLRLHPPVPLDGKVVVENDTLPVNGGIQVLPGTRVVYSPYVMGRDPVRWPEPESFRPERWIVDGKFQQPNPYEFPVFQAGPRICLGMSFALLEAGVLLVRLVSGFDFELADPKACISPDCTKLTMNIKGSLNMYVRPL